MKLVSIAHLDGMYYKPRIDKELLAQYAAGLIGLSGCLKGEINSAIIEDDHPKAQELAAAVSRHPRARRISSSSCTTTASRRSSSATACCPSSAKELGLGLVAANDVHFLERTDHAAHDALICIGTGLECRR